jgi:CRISPR system Cascade subunit CasB
MTEPYDFIALAQRYNNLPPGPRAELRRVARPDDLALIPAFYRLLPGIQTDKRWQRVVFFLPFVSHQEGGGRLGQKLAGKISEARLFQVLRSTKPNDLIQLRRLAQQVEPAVDWQALGKMLFYWGEMQKRRLIEDYFTPVTSHEKEAQS